MITPPPIQETWKVDTNGKLTSPAWINWLQSVSDQEKQDVIDLSILAWFN